MLTDDERCIMEMLNNRIQKEQDSEKLLRLIELLNKLLDHAAVRTESIRKGKATAV